VKGKRLDGKHCWLCKYIPNGSDPIKQRYLLTIETWSMLQRDLATTPEELILAEIDIANKVSDRPHFIKFYEAFKLESHPFKKDREGSFICIRSDLFDGCMEDYLKSAVVLKTGDIKEHQLLIGSFLVQIGSALLEADKDLSFRHNDMKLLNVLFKHPTSQDLTRICRCKVSGHTWTLPPSVPEMSLADFGNSTINGDRDWEPMTPHDCST
jgi:serine/threonine protein kinase